jgi:VWFA-related protein
MEMERKSIRGMISTARAAGAGLVLCALAMGAATLAPAARSAAAAAGQSATAGQQPIRVQVDLVNLFATVRDKKTKKIATGLEQGDFKVSEDNTPQEISSFSRETSLPITLGLLIDTSGSVAQTLGAEQEAAVRFLNRVMRKGDLAMVIGFSSDADLLAGFTEDRTILERAIRRTRISGAAVAGPLGGSPPGTVFYDAIYLACTDKLAQEAGRKALVILTDAQDSGSRMRAEDAIEAAQRTDTVVHVLLIAPTFGGNEGAAKKLSEETGGRTIVVRNERNLEQAFDQISEELRSQYVLGYYSTNTARDGSFRKVKVESTRKDVDVLTRRGYYAPRN